MQGGLGQMGQQIGMMPFNAMGQAPNQGGKE